MTARKSAPHPRANRRGRVPHTLRWPPLSRGDRHRTAAATATPNPRPNGAARPRPTTIQPPTRTSSSPETRTPDVTNDTHDKQPDLASEPQHRPQEPQNKSKNHPQIKSQIKINNRSHLGITIRWGGPGAAAPGQMVAAATTGGGRC
jgi:hypothetical protein